MLQHSLRNSWQQVLMALQLLPSKPARILSTVNKLNNGMSYSTIDPSFFVVTVDLWSGNGEEERIHVLNNTPREKVQRDRRRRATHDNRPDSVILPLLQSTDTKINTSPGFYLSCQRTSSKSRSSYLQRSILSFRLWERRLVPTCGLSLRFPHRGKPRSLLIATEPHYVVLMGCDGGPTLPGATCATLQCSTVVLRTRWPVHIYPFREHGY